MFYDTGVQDIKFQREAILDGDLKYLLDLCNGMALVAYWEVNSMGASDR